MTEPGSSRRDPAKFGSIERAQLSVDRVSRAEFEELIAHARTNVWPEHWPEDVRVLSLEGATLLGADQSGNVYFNGKRLYTARRLGGQERLLAWIAAVVGIIAAASSGVQAYKAIYPSPAPQSLAMPARKLAYRLPAEQVTVRLDRDVLDRLRAGGAG